MRLLPLLLILAACDGDNPGKESSPTKESNTTDDSAQDSQTATETSCNDEADNDGDTLYDCDDPDCARDSACVGSENCTDGRDNDVDGDTDCADSDCASDPACVTAEICDNSIDDDGDGQTDCQDGDCATDPACAGTEICDDGLDNDGDGQIDCDDRQCNNDPACAAEVCDNGVDDDNDGLIDCTDPDCSTDIACAVEVCDDSMDNDGDGQVDCNDQDCAAELSCQPEVCDNGVDDNADGRADCDDPDCVNEAACFVCYETDLGSAYGTAVASGNTSGMGSQRDPSCIGNVGVEDVVYQWVAPTAGIWTFSTDGSDYDTVLTLEVAGCGTESQCNDDYSGLTSYIEQSLNAGDTVFINVDGYSTTGNYVLNIDLLAESDCGDGTDNDSDGNADCADSDCASYANCLPESVCDDGTDNDSDGNVDCADSDCASYTTCLPESVCDDGLDSDLDALTDCSDSDCSGDIVCGAGSCTDGHLGRVLGSNVLSGSTAAANDDRQASCGSGGEEIAYSWTAPIDGTFSFITDNGHSIQLEEGDCLGTALDCADTGILNYTLSEGQTVVLVIDNNTSADGTFSLSIYADHEIDCADGMDDDGDAAIDCDDSDCPSALLDWYPDGDGDHFGENRGLISTCVPPIGYVYDGNDCDDRDAHIHPYRWEDNSNGIDDDCDGLADTADTDIPTEFFFGDDEADEYVFSNFSYDFCGSNYSSIFVSSNGLLGLDGSSTAYTESAASFLSPGSAPYAMIAGVWDDLNPNGAPISVIEYSDAVGVYYNNIEDLSFGNSNTFAIILRQDGRILMDYDSILLTDGLSGWSCGNGTGTSADLSVENSGLTYALGVGGGTEEAYYEDFSVNENNDLSGLSISYCVQSGSDDDGDGQTGACGDMDDSLLP